MKNYLYISDSKSGYDNLALDDFFLDSVKQDELILYFYINKNAVIIGKNQNPRKECDLEAMKRDDVELVRRFSGGGAVYHDSGNLNFSFIAGKNRFDKEKFHSFILETVSSLGIPCEFSGRNDLLSSSNGRKFSGNAYCSRENGKLHHGTLLVSSDLSKLQKYLTVDPRKMKAKGVESVRSRVCNLSDINPDVSVCSLLEVIPDNYKRIYGDFERISFGESDIAKIAKYKEKQHSDEWIFGETPEFNEQIDCRLPFGCVQILLCVKEWKIISSKTFTDANDESLAEKIDNSLILCPFDKKSISGRLKALNCTEGDMLSEYVMSEFGLI